MVPWLWSFWELKAYCVSLWLLGAQATNWINFPVYQWLWFHLNKATGLPALCWLPTSIIKIILYISLSFWVVLVYFHFYKVWLKYNRTFFFLFPQSSPSQDTHPSNSFHVLPHSQVDSLFFPNYSYYTYVIFKYVIYINVCVHQCINTTY